MFSILNNCDLAIVRYLIDAGVGDSSLILPARRSGTKDAPSIVVHSHSCIEEPVNSGIYRIQVDITFESPVELDNSETEQLYFERSTLLESALRPSLDNQTLEELIGASAAAANIPFLICGVNDKGRDAGQNDDYTTWNDIAHLEIYGSQNH